MSFPFDNQEYQRFMNQLLPKRLSGGDFSEIDFLDPNFNPEAVTASNDVRWVPEIIPTKDNVLKDNPSESQQAVMLPTDMSDLANEVQNLRVKFETYSKYTTTYQQQYETTLTISKRGLKRLQDYFEKLEPFLYEMRDLMKTLLIKDNPDLVVRTPVILDIERYHKEKVGSSS